MTTTSDGALEFESEPSDGLLGVVTRAERTVLAGSEDPIGVLGIELVRGDRDPELFLEAAYAERAGSGVVERLDVRFRLELGGSPEESLLADALENFGGTAFTSVCLSPPEGEELVDVTLHFGSKLQFYSTCTALVAERMTSEQMEGVESVLGALGIRVSRRDCTLVLPRHMLRRPLTLRAQLEAIRRAERAGFYQELYAATLPVARSVRFSLRPQSGSEGYELVCTLSRRLRPEQSSIASDAVALKDFLARNLTFDPGGHRFRVENAHGDRAEYRPHGPMGERERPEWSLNWGARRK